MIFENFIAIFDNHEGSILGFATLLLVVVTICLAYFNLRLWLAQDKPYLIFRLKEHHEENQKIKRIDFDIKNIGKGPAIDITFKIDTNKYSIKSLYSHEERVLDTVELVEINKYADGIKKIRYKDINGIKKNKIQSNLWIWVSL